MALLIYLFASALGSSNFNKIYPDSIQPQEPAQSSSASSSQVPRLPEPQRDQHHSASFAQASVEHTNNTPGVQQARERWTTAAESTEADERLERSRKIFFAAQKVKAIRKEKAIEAKEKAREAKEAAIIEANCVFSNNDRSEEENRQWQIWHINTDAKSMAAIAEEKAAHALAKKADEKERAAQQAFLEVLDAEISSELESRALAAALEAIRVRVADLPAETAELEEAEQELAALEARKKAALEEEPEAEQTLVELRELGKAKTIAASKARARWKEALKAQAREVLIRVREAEQGLVRLREEAEPRAQKLTELGASIAAMKARRASRAQHNWYILYLVSKLPRQNRKQNLHLYSTS